MFLHLDCRHYRGDRPCDFHRPCEGCPHYAPMGPRVLIIKLRGLDDVVRTGALLPGLTRMFGEPPHVTWLTAPAAVPLVRRMPGVDVTLSWGEAALARLRVERFDALICLDKEPAPCAVASAVHAANRFGIGLSRYGTVEPMNAEAEYYFELGLSDEEKFFKNAKTYRQLIYEVIGLEYRGERSTIEPSEADLAAAEARFDSFEAPGVRHWIGLNPGAGDVFAYNAWRAEGYVALARALARRRPAAGCLLLGGPAERDLLDRIEREAATENIFRAGEDNPLGPFAAIIGRCAAVVTGDTLAMHLAIARARRVVAIFGPTCEQEIDLFGLGEKIKSPIECSPCYRRACDKSPTCQDEIPDARVIDAVFAQLDALDAEATPATAPPIARSPGP